MFFLIRLLIRLALTALLLWVMDTKLPQYFDIAGGPDGLMTLAIVLTALNLTIRPILNLLTLPLRLITGLVASVLVNTAFLWITITVLDAFDQNVLVIRGGFVGWLLVAIMIGLGSWAIRLLTMDR